MQKHILASAVLALSTLAVASAQAGSAADCGNIELLTIGECHFEFEGGCKANCQSLAFVAACDGQCNGTIETTCTSTCSGSCVAECDAQPATFDCKASCEADCEAQVVSQCEAGDTECQNYCRADCSSNCRAQCSATPPQADCQAQCDACCSGSCETEANFECSLSCSAQLKGGCEVDCDAPEGALFCDGQYIAVNNLEGCVEYLAENFKVKVEGRVEGKATLSAGGCSATSSDGKSGPTAFGIALGLAALAAGRTAQRRRKS